MKTVAELTEEWNKMMQAAQMLREGSGKLVKVVRDKKMVRFVKPCTKEGKR